MSKARCKPPTALTPDEILEIERRRAQVKARLRNAPHDEVDPAETDPENPPMSDEELRTLRPAHEMRPELVAGRLRTPDAAIASLRRHRAK